MKLFTVFALIFSSSFALAEAKLKTMDCAYQSGPRSEYQLAVIEYVRKSTLKSIWLAPNKEADHKETIFVDGCGKEEDGDYICSNPVYDDSVGATFDGEELTVTISGKKPTIYSCSEAEIDAKSGSEAEATAKSKSATKSQDKSTTKSKSEKVKTSSLFCMQSVPNTVWGYIIDDAEVELSTDEPRIKINSMGIGIINQEGDGTVSDILIEPKEFQQPDYTEKAKSKEWKDAIPFVLKANVESDKKYVLYIEAKAFEKIQKENFAGRLKVSEGTKIKNYTLYCVH